MSLGLQWCSDTVLTCAQALSFIYDPKLVASLFEGAQERYSDRVCGYCKVSKELFPRRGDNALMATIELL